MLNVFCPSVICSPGNVISEQRRHSLLFFNISRSIPPSCYSSGLPSNGCRVTALPPLDDEQQSPTTAFGRLRANCSVSRTPGAVATYDVANRNYLNSTASCFFGVIELCGVRLTYQPVRVLELKALKRVNSWRKSQDLHERRWQRILERLGRSCEPVGCNWRPS